MNKYLWLRVLLVCTFPLVTLIRARGHELAIMSVMVRDYCVNFGEFFFEVDKKEDRGRSLMAAYRYKNGIEKIRSVV